MCVWAFGVFSGPRGGGGNSHSAQLAALSSLSVHLSLCSLLPPSSCSPSRPINQLSRAQLALQHWVTFKDPALLINTETAALYSMSVLSFLPLLLLPLPISKSKVLHLLMMKQLLHICTTRAFTSKQKIMHSPTFFLFVPNCVTLFLITPVIYASM